MDAMHLKGNRQQQQTILQRVSYSNSTEDKKKIFRNKILKREILSLGRNEIPWRTKIFYH